MIDFMHTPLREGGSEGGWGGCGGGPAPQETLSC